MITWYRLQDVAKPVEAEGPATINRQDRGRFIQISGDITPGAGMGEIMTDVSKSSRIEVKRCRWACDMSSSGQAENFQELGAEHDLAVGSGSCLSFSCSGQLV